MKILLVVLSLFVLAGCESMDFTSVTVGTTYSTYRPHNHISYTLGYYTSNYYNGYRVHGSHGHRYYYAPRGYSRHHYYPRQRYVRPVVVHQHVHVASCYARGGHSYTPPRPRHTPVPNRTPPRHTPPRQRDDRVDRQDRREDRNDRRGNRRDRDRQHKK